MPLNKIEAALAPATSLALELLCASWVATTHICAGVAGLMSLGLQHSSCVQHPLQWPESQLLGSEQGPPKWPSCPLCLHTGISAQHGEHSPSLCRRDRSVGWSHSRHSTMSMPLITAQAGRPAMMPKDYALETASVSFGSTTAGSVSAATRWS